MDVLETGDVGKLNFWLSCLVCEVRNKKGDCYPPKTIQQILAGLALEATPTLPRFLDRNYVDLHKTCDSVYRQLHQEGIGTVVHHTAIFTAEEC